MLKNMMKITINPASLFLMFLLTIAPSLARTVCVTEPFTAITSNQGSIPLPATGKFVLESHLATKSDSFPNNRLFPQSATEGMNTHLDRSCQVIKTIDQTIDCKDVYKTIYHKQWTPPENGLWGQGSVGNLKPSVREEMFTGNMMWKGAKKPAPGTKFLASYNGKKVVVVMGYETGPRDRKFLGGFQGEVLYFLKANDTSMIKLEKLKDQSILPGPVECGNVSKVKFTKPSQGQVFSLKESVTLQGTTASDVIKVKLIADNKWELVSLPVGQGIWSTTYEFSGSGNRQIKVLGFDSSDRQVAEDTVMINVRSSP